MNPSYTWYSWQLIGSIVYCWFQNRCIILTPYFRPTNRQCGHYHISCHHFPGTVLLLNKERWTWEPRTMKRPPAWKGLWTHDHQTGRLGAVLLQFPITICLSVCLGCILPSRATVLLQFPTTICLSVGAAYCPLETPSHGAAAVPNYYLPVCLSRLLTAIKSHCTEIYNSWGIKAACPSYCHAVYGFRFLKMFDRKKKFWLYWRSYDVWHRDPEPSVTYSQKLTTSNCFDQFDNQQIISSSAAANNNNLSETTTNVLLM